MPNQNDVFSTPCWFQLIYFAQKWRPSTVAEELFPSTIKRYFSGQTLARITFVPQVPIAKHVGTTRVRYRSRSRSVSLQQMYVVSSSTCRVGWDLRTVGNHESIRLLLFGARSALTVCPDPAGCCLVQASYQIPYSTCCH